MADFTALKTAIQNAIKQNGNEEITGTILQEIMLAVVSTLGDSAINDLVTALSNEVTNRQNADGTLQSNINAEQSARQLGDSTLQSGINNERDLRVAADNALSNRITAITDAIDNGYVYAGIATTSTEPVTGKVFYLTTATGVFTNFGGITVNTKGIKILKMIGSTWMSDTVIVMDDTPTENSTNLVKSGGVYASIASVLSKIAEGYLYVGIATAATNPSTPTTKVFYIATAAGTYTNFLDSSSQPLVLTQGINFLKYNGTSWASEQVWGVNDEPTPSSNNLVKSGGAFDFVMKNGSAFDLTAYNNGTTYADLNAALTALNALPATYKKGGMSMKFVQTSDNKYVQYRLKKSSFTTNRDDWYEDDVDGDTAKNPYFVNGLINSQGVFAENDNYRCSSFLPTALIPYLDITSLSAVSIIYYDANKIFQLSQTSYKGDNGLLNINTEYKYFRYWKAATDIDKIKIVWISDLKKSAEYANESVILSKGLFTLDTIGWTNQIIYSTGTIVDNASYSCSSFIPLIAIDKISNNNADILNCNIVLYDKDKTMTPLDTINVTWANGNTFYLSDLKERYGADCYIRIWFAYSDTNTAAQQLIWHNSYGIVGNIQNEEKQSEEYSSLLSNLSKTVYGNVPELTQWVHRFVSSQGLTLYDQRYSCSTFIPVERISRIAFNNANHSNYNIMLYENNSYSATPLFTENITDGICDITTFIDNYPTAKYMLLWLAESNTETAKGLFSFLCDEALYGATSVDTVFTNGFINSRGDFVENSNYSCSDFIETDYVGQITVDDETPASLNLNIFARKELSSILGYRGSLPKSFNLQSMISQYPNAKYFRIWFAESNTSTAKEATAFEVFPNGKIADIDVKINGLEKATQQPSSVFYLNGGGNLQGLIAVDKSNSYANITSQIAINTNGITIPVGSGKWTWLNKNIRCTPRVYMIDFVPNGCTLLTLGTMAFGGGVVGVFSNIAFYVEISNGRISCTNGQSENFSFDTNTNYRILLKQEDKHTELSVINLKSGASSGSITYDGITSGNDGLFYDTWAINAETASPYIKQYQIYTPVKRPFLSLFGDSITVGFNGTVANGINHSKYSYIVGNATGKDFTVTGRGGGQFRDMFGDYLALSGINDVWFDGMLMSELPALRPNYAMLTLGTNGGGSYSDYQAFVEYALSLGITPILNTLPIRADGGTDQNVDYIAAANATIMQIWKDYNIHGARFDLATSLNNDGETIDTNLFSSDRIHPNDAGHAAMAARVMLDCPELFD